MEHWLSSDDGRVKHTTVAASQPPLSWLAGGANVLLYKLQYMATQSTIQS